MSSVKFSGSCSNSILPPTEKNSMDLNDFFSVTCDNNDFSKTCSLLKHDPIAHIEAELLHQFNLSIHNLESELKQQ